MRIRVMVGRLAAGAWLAVGPALAQAPAPPMDSLPEKIPPDAKPTKNLSEKLNRSNGVIQPRDVDPAIEKPAPKAVDPNVIPPPGAQGGAPAPQPK